MNDEEIDKLPPDKQNPILKEHLKIEKERFKKLTVYSEGLEATVEEDRGELMVERAATSEKMKLKDEKIAELIDAKATLEKEKALEKESVKQKDLVIQDKDVIIKDKDSVIKGKDATIQDKDSVIKGKDATIKDKDKMIANLLELVN